MHVMAVTLAAIVLGGYLPTAALGLAQAALGGGEGPGAGPGISG